jgi:hypothetical protein
MNELKEAYRSGRLILFVGSGVSANLGLPTWSGLVEQIAKELGYDPNVFATYGEPLALAEYYRRKTGTIGPLRSWMDREWHKDSIDVKTSDVHRYIVEGRFSRIYTTNYDRWLEHAHKEHGKSFVKVASVADMVNANDNERQIVKLHGDFDDDKSIVLDETSYFERLDFETPLDIKLRAEVLGKSVLFIGYSVSDINIRLMFYKLTKMWSNHALASARPKSYMFSHRPNPVAEEVLSQWGINMVISQEADPKAALTSFMKDLVR